MSIKRLIHTSLGFVLTEVLLVCGLPGRILAETGIAFDEREQTGGNKEGALRPDKARSGRAEVMALGDFTSRLTGQL